MLPDKDRMCHRTGFDKSCRMLVVDGGCKRWKNVLGAHPQTGAEMNHYDCADDLIFLLLLNLGKQQGETTASVDKVATEVRGSAERQENAATELIASHARMGLDMRQMYAATLDVATIANEQRHPQRLLEAQ